MKTKLEIIDETVAYYSEDLRRRAANEDNSSCRYLMPTGQMCAVGRCMEQPTEEMEGPADGISIRVGSTEELTMERLGERLILDELLKPEYRGYEVAFWKDLQHLHDDMRNWEPGGLSEFGKGTVSKLKGKWVF